MKTSMESRRPALFLDTWGWVAIGDRADPGHNAADAQRKLYQATGRLVTTDYVLDETFTALFRQLPFSLTEQYCEGILRTAEMGALSIERITSDRFQAAWRLRLRYSDKPLISFTDLTSFVVMQELGITDVLTADSHFAKLGLGFKLVP